MAIVTLLPLPNDALAPAIREGELGADDIRALLRDGPVQFVVADVGHPLRWIPVASCFSFWKEELRERTAPVDEAFRLDQFPGQHCYTAVRWQKTNDPLPLIVLEVHH